MTTNNFDFLLNTAKEQGLIVKEFCTFCSNGSSGHLEVDDGAGSEINLPVCEPCVRAIAEKHAAKMDGLDSLQSP